MAHQIYWTEKTCQSFIKKAMLNDDEIYILTSRIRGATVTEQSLHLNKSTASVHRMIKKLRQKYDVIQKEFPTEFPKRRISKQEEYMDTH